VKEVKVRRVSEELFELELPFWYWSPSPYIIKGLKQIIADGDFPFYVYRKFGLREIYVVVTTRISTLKT